MKSGSVGRYAAITLFTALVLVICVLFIDRPVADFVAAHVGPVRPIQLALTAEALLVPLSILWILGCGLAVILGRDLSRFAATMMHAGFSLTLGLVTNYFLLQPFFGRIEISHYLAHHDAYGFALLQGHGGTGFPSGHTVIAAAFLLAFWHGYPRARIVVALGIAAVMLSLVLAQWHFVSDTIASVYVGAVAAKLATALLRRGDES